MQSLPHGGKFVGLPLSCRGSHVLWRSVVRMFVLAHSTCPGMQDGDIRVQLLAMCVRVCAGSAVPLVLQRISKGSVCLRKNGLGFLCSFFPIGHLSFYGVAS